MTEPKHNPVPWKVIQKRVVVDANGDYVRTFSSAADAELIVRAVNSHAALLEASEAMSAMTLGDIGEANTARYLARKAIALAETEVTT